MANTVESRYSLKSLGEFANQNFIIIVMCVVLFGVGFFLGSTWTENKILKSGTGTAILPSQNQLAAAPNQQPTMGEPPEVTDQDHIRGNKNAEVTIVEYSDFECPFCAQFHPTLKQVLEEYDGKVRWVYRHFPLPFHPNAQKAAEGSECVAKLGGNDAFWKYGDAIFAENTKLGGKLTPESITLAAKESGVNEAEFKKCLDSGEMTQKVADSDAGGTAAGVNGTPGSFIINKEGKSEFLNGAYSPTELKAAIERNL